MQQQHAPAHTPHPRHTHAHPTPTPINAHVHPLSPVFATRTRCPTVFPAPPGMGATFNLTLAHRMGVAIGNEARAMNNVHGCRHRGGGGCGWGNGNWYIGLNVWVPNLNIYRE